jgi:hypothetical protein
MTPSQRVATFMNRVSEWPVALINTLRARHVRPARVSDPRAGMIWPRAAAESRGVDFNSCALEWAAVHASDTARESSNWPSKYSICTVTARSAQRS